MTEWRFPVRRPFLRTAVSSLRRVVAAAPNGCGHGRAAWGSVSAGTICRAAAMRRSARRVSIGAPAFSDSCVCVIAAHQICDPASYRRFNRGILPRRIIATAADMLRPRSSKIRCAVPRDSGMGCVIIHVQALNSRSLFNDCAYGSPDVAPIEHGESPATPDAKVLPAEGLSNHVNGRLHARRPQILKPVDREVVPAVAKQKCWAVSGHPERCLACNIWTVSGVGKDVSVHLPKALLNGSISAIMRSGGSTPRASHSSP